MPERKKPQRARIDAIIAAIKKGDYDDKLSDLSEAIELRNGERQAALREKVLEVFGPGFEITAKPHPNPFIGKAGRDKPREVPATPAPDADIDPSLRESQLPTGGPGDPFGDGTVQEGDPIQPQAVEIVSDRTAGASEHTGSPPPVPQGDVQMSDDDGYESRSPIITGGPPQ